MNITLRSGEKLYINGAVVRVDRKATIELLNDASFLLETHVMQPSDATTPLRQIYFVLQIMLMDPTAARVTSELAGALIEKATGTFATAEIRVGLKLVSDLVGRARCFEAMKTLRAMYAVERREMFPLGDIETTQAA